LKKLRLVAAAAAALVAAALVVNLALTWRDVSGAGVLILMYHRVADDAGGAEKYVMPVDAFSGQLDALREDGFTFISPHDFVSGRSPLAGSKPVLVTFDDGTEDHYLNVFPLLEKRGITGLFFVTAGRVGRTGYLTREELKEMAARGQVIGSHSSTHRLLNELAGDDLRDELVSSKADLEGITERPVEMVAPPGGWFDRRVVAAARTAGYRKFLTTAVGLSRGGPEYVSPRANVPGTLSLADFRRLVGTPGMFRVRFVQRVKYLAGNLLGPARSLALARRLGLSTP
jgi:peptidoglycan/xylan/chitin deacetylase (PgdA/CDA1 family)